MPTRRIISWFVLLVVNAALWLTPSDVVELVARDRHTLLGYYSRGHLTANLIVLIVSAIGLYIDGPPSPRVRRRRFQLAAVLVLALPAVTALDIAARALRPVRYIKDTLAYHRNPHDAFVEVFIDRPTAARSYPNAPPGFGKVRCEYHADARGYRNAIDREASDIVVLGDSFAEGSSVSDEHVWPVRLANETEWSVCNLGMSGYAPPHYLASLRAHGLAQRPRVVLCMLYEGNDFRGGSLEKARAGPAFSKRVKTYFKQSPVIRAIDGFLIGTLGPIGCDREVPGLEALSWLPLAVPDGEHANYYAFAPKQILQNLHTAETFAQSDNWRNVAEALDGMRDACAGGPAELVVVYAPIKARVVLPLARHGLDPVKVRAFAAIRSDELPPAAEFFESIFDRFGAKETVVRDWCVRRNVRFISTTAALRRRAAAGEQVYYTYDQHWTPIGHRVVADVVREALATGPLSPSAVGQGP